MRGEVEVFDESAHKQHGAFQPVGVLVTIGHRVPDEPPHVVFGREVVVETLSRWPQRVAAAKGGLHQVLRPDTLLVCLPELVAAVCLQPLYTGLATPAALHHALYGFEAVEVVTIHSAVADAHRFPDPRPKRHF